MNIRIAGPDDIGHLVDFNQAMARETEGKELDRERLTNGVSAVLTDANKGFYVVAESGGTIIGGLLVTFEWSDWRNAWFWWIQSVYVISEHRGRGVYSQMYDFVRQRAGKDVCGFRLYVEAEKTAAQAVYEKCGMHRSHYLMFET